MASAEGLESLESASFILYYSHIKPWLKFTIELTSMNLVAQRTQKIENKTSAHPFWRSHRHRDGTTVFASLEFPGNISKTVMNDVPSLPIGDFENTLSFPSEKTSLGSGLSSHLP
jgi:hypothetical protein